MIGIHVFESREKPASGQQLSGLSVASVDHPWSGDDVGIRAKARPISDSTYLSQYCSSNDRGGKLWRH